ncbi:MAG: TenA family protein [Candidatus Diapherotrites archaeon]|nr:TenA family protein [Candidatus Diapherotrites archaeon]
MVPKKAFASKPVAVHARLWNENLDLADACLSHPFVQGIASGRLEMKAFKIYVCQDAFFLKAFRQAYRAAKDNSAEERHREIFSEFIAGVDDELKLHRAYSKKLGINIERVAPLPACSAYTSFLLETARNGDVSEILAAIAPCVVLYAFLGKKLAGFAQPGNPYSGWIETYSGKEIRSLAEKVEALLDETADYSDKTRNAYRKAMQLELEFFSEPLNQ